MWGAEFLGMQVRDLQSSSGLREGLKEEILESRLEKKRKTF